MEIKKIVSQMTLEEKAGLCSGKDFWHTKEIERLGIKSVMVTDGPHGLRKQKGMADHLGLHESVPATCFPPAAATANSFNKELLYEIGQAIGREASKEEVAVVLGPGINIKRSPLCGRNFEYFSEDPLVAGELSAALVQGIQSNGVGACLKHFAANSQEQSRFINNSIIDERTLREIYLAAFEIAVKKADPWTVMCSYNLINGIYACENKKLLTDILRDEWGFKGYVMTDWGAMNERVDALRAGLELEMPASNGMNDKLIVEGVKEGRLQEEILNKACERILNVHMQYENRKPVEAFDFKEHHALARKAAADSAVLLKNEANLLPLRKDSEVLILGKFAEELRFQGGGSSNINPVKVDNFLRVMEEERTSHDYAPGYDIDKEGVQEDLIKEAVEKAKVKENVIIFAGLPDSYENEGYDRTHLNMPLNQIKLIEKVSEVNKNVVVVLLHGAVITLPWLSKVKSVLSMSLPGQAGGGAVYDLIYGKVVPSGRVAETYPLALEDNPSFENFGHSRESKYLEGIYVGYRYYNTADKAVQFPFGYGLSYSEFSYSDMTVDDENIAPKDTLRVSVKVKNIGEYDGSEVVQVYIAPPKSNIFRPKRQLKAFDKVFLRKGEEKLVTFELTSRDFAYYDVNRKDWRVESGEYTVEISKDVNTVLLKKVVKAEGDISPEAVPDYRAAAPTYYNLQREGKADFTVKDFEPVYGSKVPEYKESTKGNFHINSTLGDIKDTFIGKIIYKKVQQTMILTLDGKSEGFKAMAEAMINDMPLRALILFSQGMVTRKTIEGLLLIINGKVFKGIAYLVKK